MVDDDDNLALNCLEKMSRAIALHLTAALTEQMAAQVDENEIQLNLTRRVGPGKAFYIPQEDLHYGMLLELVPFGTPIQVAFRRDAFLKSGGWDPTFNFVCDDIDSWIKIARFGDGIFINQCLAYRTVWPGGDNQKFSLAKILNVNILIKQKIYSLVPEKYQRKIPSFSVLETYLKLHWGLVAMKMGYIVYSIQTLVPHIFSASAWKLLLNRFYFTYLNLDNPKYQIRRFILLEEEDGSE